MRLLQRSQQLLTPSSPQLMADGRSDETAAIALDLIDASHQLGWHRHRHALAGAPIRGGRRSRHIGMQLRVLILSLNGGSPQPAAQEAALAPQLAVRRRLGGP